MGFVLQLFVQWADGDHTGSENITDRQLFPLLFISVFFGFIKCDSQNTELEGIWTHSRTQHRQ